MSLPIICPGIPREQFNRLTFDSFPNKESGIEPQSWQSLNNHGNWCGYNNTRSDQNYPTVDTVDEVCRTHDICVSSGHKCSCDSRFIDGMRRAVVAPNVGSRGRAYAAAAITTFQAKPCYCDVRVLGTRIRVPGIGGRCGGAPRASNPHPRIPRLPRIPSPRVPRPRWPF